MCAQRGRRRWDDRIRLIVALAAVTSPVAAQCLDWNPKFQGLPSATDKWINCSVVFDDGTGAALYVAGAFATAGDIAASGIARWNGASYSALSSGVGGTQPTPLALAVYDDGSGPALYAGGSFTSAGGVGASCLARWDGSAWSAVGGGVTQGIDPVVRALAVFDDGGGPAIYIAGQFDHAGGTPAFNIAKWNGSSWTPLGPGVNGAVYSMAAFDDGSGPALFVAGILLSAGGVLVNNIARWSRNAWSAVGQGLNDYASAATVFDDGSGPALYVGGTFTRAGGMGASHIAKWDGTSWSPLGTGTNASVSALSVFDDGSGPALYAGGAFQSAGGIAASHFARWNGSMWSNVGAGIGGTPSVNSLCVFDDGHGARLHASGFLTSIGTLASTHLVRFDGSAWSPPGSTGNLTQGMNGTVSALAVLDSGSGPALHAAGSFSAAGTHVAMGVASWDGSSWSPLGEVDFLSDGVRALAAFDAGGSAMVYAGGAIALAGHVVVDNITRWNGSNWEPLPSGGIGGLVNAFAVYDDGSNPALYVGGAFSSAGLIAANAITRFDGGSYSPLGSGMNGAVNALAVFDDGGGSALYAGGAFTIAGGISSHYVAKWHGSAWSPLGGGTDFHVYALLPFDDGSGNALYAAGAFTHANGVGANRVARWNGSAWSPLGSGFDDGVVFALGVFDDGSGPALYAGGGFTTAGGVAMPGIARWNGNTWSALGSGTSAIAGQNIVHALASFDDGSGHGPELYAGGSFTNAGPNASAYIAQWRGCASPIDTFCFGDGSVAPCPCGNVGFTKHGCDNSASTGGARLVATGAPSPDTLVLHSTGELPSALSIFLQGDALVSASAHFGDGLRCAGGNLKRLYAKNAITGGVIAPGPGDLSISQQSAALGDPIAPGSTRYYQTYYRDSNLAFCPPPQGDSWNVTNGVRVVW